MKVALVVHRVRAAGGQDRYALELARRLASACTFDLVTIRADGELPDEVTLLTARAPLRPLLLTALLFQWSARAALRHRHYDVVHTVGGALPGANVITAQYCHAAWRAVRRAATPYHRLVTAQAIAHERRAYRHPSLRAVIAVSRRTEAEVVTHYGPLAVPVTVIPNAVDPAVFAPRARPASNGPPVLLFIGAYERKGLDTAIRALARMSVPAELVAIGEGRRASLQRLAQELGVADRVRFGGVREDIASAFSGADAFVFPTRYEPFGMVVAEALASGLPVVTSAAAGAADLIRDGASGFVIDDS